MAPTPMASERRTARRASPRGWPARRTASRSTALLHAELLRLVAGIAAEYAAAIVTARQHPDRGAIHALRITTRRVKALRTLLDAIDPQPPNERLDRYLDAPFRACGRLRDLQVMARRLRGMHLGPAAIAQLRRILRRLEPRIRARAISALAKAHPRRVAKMLYAQALRLDMRLQAPAASAMAARRIKATLEGAARELASARDRVRAGGADADADAEAIHQARIALKQRRYMLELVGPLGLGRWRSELERLRLLQRELGEVTDCMLMLRILDRYIRKHPHAAQRLAGLRTVVAEEQLRLAALLI
jgi:CHAD domain-containing protein